MHRPKISMEGQIAVVTVAEEGMLTRAAAQLGLTASAISKQIVTVEQEVGTELFHRSRGRMLLTDAGKIYIPEAMQSIMHARLGVELVRAHVRIQSDTLAVGYSTFLNPALIGIIKQLRLDREYDPKIELHSLLTQIIVQKVLSGELHVGFGFLPIQHPDLRTRAIFEEPVVVCLPEHHVLTQKRSLRPEDIAGQTLVAVAREAHPELHEETVEYFHAYGITLNFVADGFCPHEALLLVAQGIGLCLMTNSSAMLARSGIVVRPLTEALLTRKSGVFTRFDHDDPLIDAYMKLAWKQTEPLRLRRR